MHSTGTIPRRWSIADSREIYTVRQWGGRFFDINEAGHLVAFPAQGAAALTAGGEAPPGIDLKELVDEVRERGIGLPLLIRFPEILKSRIVDLNEAFRNAISEYGYQGSYRGVYPIKVNQDRYVVEQIVHYGRPYHYGLEAGSKPELLAVLANLDDEDALVPDDFFGTSCALFNRSSSSILSEESRLDASWRASCVAQQERHLGR